MNEGEGKYEVENHGREFRHDPTAYSVMIGEECDHRRVNKLLRVIFDICELSGFRVVGRIQLKDLRTDRVWK